MDFESEEFENPASTTPTTSKSAKEMDEEGDDDLDEAKEDKFDMFGGAGMDFDKNLDKMVIGEEVEDEAKSMKKLRKIIKS